MSDPTATPPLKSGWKTTEFWGMLAAKVAGVLATAGVLGDGSTAARVAGLIYRHDISVAVSKIPAFIRTAGAALESHFPGTRVICFGHLGDGNLHYNAFVPGRDHTNAAAREATDVNRVVHDVITSMEGSISAEHGIGLSKREELARCKEPLELELMRSIKVALDPAGLMNPGKIF